MPPQRVILCRSASHNTSRPFSSSQAINACRKVAPYIDKDSSLLLGEMLSDIRGRSEVDGRVKREVDQRERSDI